MDAEVGDAHISSPVSKLLSTLPHILLKENLCFSPSNNVFLCRNPVRNCCKSRDDYTESSAEFKPWYVFLSNKGAMCLLWLPNGPKW